MEIITGRTNRIRTQAIVCLIVNFIAITLMLPPLFAKEPLLIIRVAGSDFEQTVYGLREELVEDFNIRECIVNKKTSVAVVQNAMRNKQPKLVVLMDNISITLFKNYQKTLDDADDKFVPSVCLMAAFMDLAIKGLKNTTGIFYEVPVVTSVVSLRRVLPELSLKKIGVVHRGFMSSSIKSNQAYCQKENIKLISYKVSDRRKNLQNNLKNGLDNLKRKKKIDALWVSNDNMMINANLLRSVWIPFAKKFKKPIIVSVEILVNSKFNFGSFAVIPDSFQLGTQAAEIIFDIMDNNWKVDGIRIEQPRSVYKIANKKQMEKQFKASTDNLADIDKLLE